MDNQKNKIKEENRGRTELHSVETKNQWTLEVCALRRQGLSKADACKKIGISPSLFEYWYKVLSGRKVHRPRPDVTALYSTKFYADLALTEQDRIQRLQSSSNGKQPQLAKPVTNGNQYKPQMNQSIPSKGNIGHSNGNGTGNTIGTIKVQVTRSNGTVLNLEGSPIELAELLTRMND